MSTTNVHPNWTTEFDPILNQVYYVNIEDGSVTFDLPCEVHNVPKRKTVQSFLNKLSSKWALKTCPSRCFPVRSNKRTSDVSGREQSQRRSMQTVPSLTASSSYTKDVSIASARSFSEPGAVLMLTRDTLMTEPSFDLYRNQDDDVSSLSSADSIQSFYSELPSTDIEYEYASSFTSENDSRPALDLDKEIERLELRQQILKELY